MSKNKKINTANIFMTMPMSYHVMTKHIRTYNDIVCNNCEEGMFLIIFKDKSFTTGCLTCNTQWSSNKVDNGISNKKDRNITLYT